MSKHNNLPAPDALMKTLPFRLSFPLESTERPKLKMDLHFLDFPDSFLLQQWDKKCAQPSFLMCTESAVVVETKLPYLLSDTSMTVW